MDARVREFVEQVAVTVAGLEVALFFQDNPNAFDSAPGLAMRIHRPMREVAPALERLADYGLLERHQRDQGRVNCYALTRDPVTWDLVCRVSEGYLDDPAARKEIIRLLMSEEHRQVIPESEHPRPSRPHDRLP